MRDDRTHRLVFSVIAASTLWSIVLLVARIASVLEFDATHSDAAFYLNMGRAILNGLVPYEDIFEPKPPGIFILSAISLALFRNETGGNVLSAGIILAFPLLITSVVARRAGSLPRHLSMLLIATAFQLGALLGLWNSIQALWQPESFGNVFALLFALLLVTEREGVTLQRTFVAAIVLLGAIGFKEPLLLGGSAAALVLCKSPRAFWRSFLLPVFIALIAGAILLFLFGWLGPYVSVYFPAVAGIRIVGYGPLWMRGLLFWRLSAPLSHTSPLLLPMIILAVAWSLRDRVTLSDHRKWRITALVIGAYLSTTAVMLAGNYTTPTYSAVLIPFVLALAVEFLLRARAYDGARREAFLLGYCLIVSALVWTIPFAHVYSSATTEERAQTQELKDAARRLDGLLLACGEKQYLYAVNPPQPFLPVHTKASPLNHFPYREIDNILFGFPFLRKTLERLSESRIIIVNPEGFTPTGSLGSLLQEYIQKTFTQEPWPCAKSWLPIGGYQVLFRARPGTIAVTETVDVQGKTILNFEY